MTTLPPERPGAVPGQADHSRRGAALGTPGDAVLDEAAMFVDTVAGEVDPQLEAEMDHLDNPRRMLLVHAHPDDETIGNGVTMAKYAAEGAHVSLVTCTLGEEGEVVVPELEHLAAAREDALGRHRVGELSTAMEALGVKDFRFLGGPGRYRDSGMMGEPTNDRKDAFWQADLDEAGALLAAVIREVRPQVVITYDENGGYGHPDHIQAHRVALRGVELAAAGGHGAGERWQVGKVYHNAIPRSAIEEGFAKLRAAGKDFFGLTSPEDLPGLVEDADVTAEIDGREYVAGKLAAMRAHATQITADGPFFEMSAIFGDAAWGLEYYRLVQGTPGRRGGSGWETDLFSGLA